MNLESYLSNVEHAAALADRLGISPVLISQWRTGVRQVPAERCPDIERVTNGVLTCEELRPDLIRQWSYLRSTSKKKAA